eukprot:TRINITY_DN10882_c0_g1_i1.p1 TRINITY_DN10882_c0_g1~~TRINITY_DN10882_c0_g1_i1.p1  ORF type:complete len:384 (-),score=41.37 TRINITY_DN10882_c0_g1_i1:193-1281(-)
MEILLPCLAILATISACLAVAWLCRRMHGCIRCSDLLTVCLRACCRFLPKSVRNRVGKKLSRSTSARSSSTLAGLFPDMQLWKTLDSGRWWKGASPSLSCPNAGEFSETSSEGAMPGPAFPQRSYTQPHLGRQNPFPDPPKHSRAEVRQAPRPRIVSPRSLSPPVRKHPWWPPSATNSTRPSSAQPPLSRSRSSPEFSGTPNRRTAWDTDTGEPEKAHSSSYASGKGTASTTTFFSRKDQGQNARSSSRDEHFAPSGASPAAEWKRACPSTARPQSPLQRFVIPAPSNATLDVQSVAGMVQQLRQLRDSTTASERRKIFKDLQLKWHPDKNAGDEERATEIFRALQDNKSWFLSDASEAPAL